MTSGPSTTVMPYLLPSRAGVDIKALLTVRDKNAENGYAMVGIPDGLGIVPDGDKFTLMMNHELGNTVGVARSHGSKGAFVSRWSIDRATQRVLTGADHITSASTLYSGTSRRSRTRPARTPTPASARRTCPRSRPS